MLLHPSKYASLLSHYMDKHKMNIWLINTGWYGGAYGVGERFPLSITRDVIRAIQNGELDNSNFITDEIFELQIPEKVRNINPKILNPMECWDDKNAYLKEAKSLRERFDTELKKF